MQNLPMRKFLKFEKPTFRNAIFGGVLAILFFIMGAVAGVALDIQRNITGMIERDLNVLIWEAAELAEIQMLLVEGELEKAKLAGFEQLDDRLLVIESLAKQKELTSQGCLGVRLLNRNLEPILDKYKGLQREHFFKEIMSELRCDGGT